MEAGLQRQLILKCTFSKLVDSLFRAGVILKDLDQMSLLGLRAVVRYCNGK
jgi:hypothetical protein